MDVLPRLTLSVILSWITPSKGVKIKAAHATVGRSGVLRVLESGSNASKRDAERLTGRVAVLAGIEALAVVSDRCENGASAARQWVREGHPHFVITTEGFDKITTGKSEPRCRWNSARKSLANKLEGADVYAVGIVKVESGIAFIPIK